MLSAAGAGFSPPRTSVVSDVVTFTVASFMCWQAPAQQAALELGRLEVTNAITDGGVPEAKQIAYQKQRNTTAHKQRSCLERRDAVGPTEQPPPGAHKEVGWIHTRPPEMGHEETVQLGRFERR